MRSYFLAALLAASSQAALAQPVQETDDTPEEIAQDAARDLKDSRFYNKPGATRAEYDADWQECRLIARGSYTPGGNATVYNPSLYNPAISPLAGAVGSGIGGLIGAAIVEGQQRRANRRSCLMIRGWRLVEPSQAEQDRVAAMSDEERDAYFNTVVGAEDVAGEITMLGSFEPVSGTEASMRGAPAGKPSLYLGRKVDLDDPIALAADEGAIMVVFRRNDEGSMGRSGLLELARFDAANGDLHYQPRNWKKIGDFTTYWETVKSKDRKAPYEIQIVRLTAGDYVFASDSVGGTVPMNTFCFGAPTFTVEPGKITYLTDLVPFMSAKQPNGEKITGMGYARDFSVAGEALAQVRPDLAERLVDGEVRNGATYSCSGMTMTRMDYPGIAAVDAIAEAGAPAMDEAVIEDAPAPPANADAGMGDAAAQASEG